MSRIKTLNVTLVVRIDDRTKKALARRALSEGKRPSEAVRKLIETYAHSKSSIGE